MKRVTNIGALADAYGLMNAEIAEIQKRQNAVREQIIATGRDAIDGELFHVSVSHSVRETPDKVLKEQLDELVEAYKSTLTSQYLTAHINKKEVVTIRPTALLKQQAA